MRKLIFVLALSLLLLPIIGCNETVKKNVLTVKPIESLIATEPNDWKTTYGEVDKTQVYYNIALIEFRLREYNAVINNQGEVIKKLMADVNDLKTDANK
jgi:hypothetical protein